MKLINFIKGKILAKLDSRRKIDNRRNFIITSMILVVMVFIYLVVIIGLGYGFSKVDPRMANLFNFEYGVDNPLLRYAEKLTFASRLVYWEAGWNVFNDYPWTGVGLGNAGFFFYDRLPPYAWKLEEIRELVYHSTEILNTKSLWVRLLSETGIIGFSFYACWLVVNWFTAKVMLQSRKKLFLMFAYFGIFVVLGMLIEGFSIDTFALPYYWISLGLVTAAFTQFAQLRNTKPNNIDTNNL